jgi:hypothetical protein
MVGPCSTHIFRLDLIECLQLFCAMMHVHRENIVRFRFEFFFPLTTDCRQMSRGIRKGEPVATEQQEPQ